MPPCSSSTIASFWAGRLREGTNLGKVLFHNLRAVVHGQDNIGHACVRQSLDLVQDHALVAELDQGFRQSQGLDESEGG